MATPAPERKENEATPEQHQPPVPIHGRFDKYRSSFWAAALAIVGLRYAPRPFLRQSWEPGKNTAFPLKHAYSAFAGSVMEGVTLIFARETWKDMRTIYAEALAWEFDKKPEEVNFWDFRNSRNTMVQQTLDNYFHRNARRAGVNLAFFTPYLLGPLFRRMNLPRESAWHPDKWHPETGADFGLSANAAYLFSDVISRKMSPFEALQTAIDRKINHADSFSDKMTAHDLLDIYERHAADGKIGSFLGERDTPDWEHAMTVFSRMADLMNQTYRNVPPHEHADFSIAKFIYLVGNNLIRPDNIEQTTAYIEVANRYDIPALKQVVKAVEDGAGLAQAVQPYPVALPLAAEAEAPQKKFTATIKPRNASMADHAKRQKLESEPQLHLPA
ncbi:MAG: hypothetical protein JO089_02420 [Alphaproteobacteria bacterium]|nr:hypothetical protein [Alphaproteobacteria bacterium]